MANTLTNLIPTLYAALDVVSRELVGFIPAVSRSSTVESAALNEPVNVPVVGAETAADITPGVTAPDTGDAAPGNVPVTISKSRMVPVRWNGEEQKAVNHTGIYGDVNQQRFAQAMRTLCNEVETDIASLHVKASRAFGTAGTTPFGTVNELDDFSKVQKILSDNGAPGDRHLVMDSSALANAQGYQNGLIYANTSNSDALRTGQIGDVFNMGLGTSGQVATHTAGGGSAYTSNDAGYAVGATDITLITGTGTVLAGDAVTFAGDTNIYIVKTGVADAGVIALAEPGLKVAIPASATALTIVATSARNMAFSRSAIVLATRMPAMPEEGDSAADVMEIVDPHSGLAFQIAMYKQYKQVHYEVGLAWGYEMIAPRHCGILLG